MQEDKPLLSLVAKCKELDAPILLLGRHPPCDAPMESPDSALFEGIGSSVPQLYHRMELTNVHAKWVVVLIFWWFLSSSFYGSLPMSILIKAILAKRIYRRTLQCVAYTISTSGLSR